MTAPTHATTCARCGEAIVYVSNPTRGYWSGITSGAVCGGLQFRHGPSPDYYRQQAPRSCSTCGHPVAVHSPSGLRPCLGTWDSGDCAALCQGFTEAAR